MTENVAIKHRYWMGIAFNYAYPVGMLYLALIANFIYLWRDIQLSLTIPAATLIIFWWFFMESPRWLLSKGRISAAYRIVFKQKPAKKVIDSKIENENEKQTDVAEIASAKLSFGDKFKSIFKEFSALYGPSRQRRTAIICHFSFFTASFCYYVTGILNNTYFHNTV